VVIGKIDGFDYYYDKIIINFVIFLFTGGVFTEEIIKDMSTFNETPIIFALR
jgi:hypothetical protein